MAPSHPSISLPEGQSAGFVARHWLWLMLTSLLGLLAFLAFTVSVSLDAYRAADHARLRDTARALAAAVDAELGMLDAGLRALSASPRLTDLELGPAILGHARMLGEGLGGSIRFASPSEALPDESWAEMPSAAPLLVGQGVRGVISNLAQEEGAYRLRLSLPVIREGELRHLMRFSFPPALLRPVLLRLDLDGGTFAAIADGSLRIIAHSQDAEGRRTGVQAPSWVGAAVEGRQRVLVTGPGWQNRPNVYAVERLAAAPGWTVVVARPEAEIEAAAWAAVSWLLLGSAAVAIGLGLAAWLARRASLVAARREADLLRQGRAELARILGALPVVVTLRQVSADGASSLLFRDGDVTAVTGWPGDELRCKNDAQYLLAPGTPGLQGFLQRTLQDGAHRDEARMRRPDGSWSWVRRGGIRLTRDAEGGGEVLMYTINMDRERLAEARAIASSRLASLGEMSSGLAHELLQPLTAILMAAENAQVALREGHPRSIDRRLDRIMEQAIRASRIIEDLRRFARGPEDKPRILPVPLDGPIRGALALTGGLLREVEVQVELGAVPPCVLGDRAIIEHVMVNLLNNARDALADLPPEVPRLLRISAVEAEGQVWLSVADNGGGVDPEVLDRIFEPFVTTKGPDRGIGLGLSVSVGLLEKLGGSISVRNTAGGALFTIRLQAAEPDIETPAFPPSPSLADSR